MADIIAIHYIGMALMLIEFFLDGMRQGGFAGAGQTGKPENDTFMVIEVFAPFSRDGGMMPDSITAFAGSLLRIVFHMDTNPCLKMPGSMSINLNYVH